MEVSRLIQQVAAGHPGEPLSGKNQRDLVTGSRKLLETGTRLVRRSHSHDAVMPRVAVPQLSLDVPQRARILVDGDQDRGRHAPTLVSGARLAIGRREPTQSVNHRADDVTQR